MVYVILGETASGKTDCALSICRALDIPLISADAYSVYRGFDIGSAKPTPEELSGIEHHFIDELDFGEATSVRDFQREGRALLDRWFEEGRDCVVAGGTFLYVRALLFPYEFPDGTAPHRAVTAEDVPGMLEELEKLDPDSVPLLDTSNPRRIERALATARAGRRKSDIVGGFVNLPLYPCIFIRVDTDPREIDSRIEERTRRMMESGLVEETRRLAERAPDFAPEFRGIGFREVYARLSSGASMDGVEEEIARDTRKYARRQRTFMRNQFPYTVAIPRERIAELAIADSLERRTDMPDSKRTSKEVELPLFPAIDPIVAPTIDRMYRRGVRQIAIFTLDRGLIDDFTYRIHRHSPLMQILYFDDAELKKGKLPPFSYVVRPSEGVRIDPELEEYMTARELEFRDPE